MYARALTQQKPYRDHQDMSLVRLAFYDHGVPEFIHLNSSGCRLRQCFCLLEVKRPWKVELRESYEQFCSKQFPTSLLHHLA